MLPSGLFRNIRSGVTGRDIFFATIDVIKTSFRHIQEGRENILSVTRKDRSKLFKAGAIFLVWIIAVFCIGSSISRTTTVQTSSRAAPSNPLGEGLSDDEKTQEQKENSIKLVAINKQGVDKDGKKADTALSLTRNGWENTDTKTRNGITSMRVYFPAGQNASAWNESFVLRSFVNITLEDPCPTVYKVYEEWMKEQIPGLKMESLQDDTGIYFNGNTDKIFVTGKIYPGSLKQTIHIAQYAVKPSNDSNMQDKALSWKNSFSKLK